MAPPEWLTRHNGELRLAPDGRTTLVYFDGAPQYKLTPSPADGRFTCVIAQMDSGKRMGNRANYATAEEALAGGLEDLRTILGW